MPPKKYPNADDGLRQLWEPSSSESEDFSTAKGADEDGHWATEIIGEDVDSYGKIRYEAAWKGWARKDGTNTTWDNSLLHEDDIKNWRKKEDKRRKQLAKESTNIEIAPWATIHDIHASETLKAFQAFEEKLAYRRKNPLNLREKADQLRAEKLALMAQEEAGLASASISTRRAAAPARTPARSVSTLASTSSRRDDTPSVAGPSKRRLAREDRSPQPQPQSRTPIPATSKYSNSKANLPATVISAARKLTRTTTASTSEYHPSSSAADLFSFTTTHLSSPSPSRNSRNSKAKGKARVVERSPSRSLTPLEYTDSEDSKADDEAEDDVEQRPKRPLPCRARRTSPNIPTARQELEAAWSAIAASSGAARITITNNIDDEEIPPLPPRFRYIESEYFYTNKVPRMEDKEVFVWCECVDRECRPGRCGCQEAADLVDERGRKVFAYTRTGRFNFNVQPGIEVVECNQYCQCSRDACLNRVAQKPRLVPIQVFKTADRGWGVCSPRDIERGQVLGLYTGLLIRRDVAEAYRGDQNGYCFDLDGKEDPDAEKTPDDAYSVDSRTCGNWTRFVNHSCSPNLITYIAVYDTIPEMNQPYIVFVAATDIPAGTEFTVDYDPAATAEHQEEMEAVRAKSKSKKKGKGKGRPAMPKGAKPCMCGTEVCRGWMRV